MKVYLQDIVCPWPAASVPAHMTERDTGDYDLEITKPVENKRGRGRYGRRNATCG